MPTTYEPIATTTLGSASTTITFSSIPATYTDLRIVFAGNNTSTGQLWLRFNSDSGANYSQTNLYGDGTSAISDRSSSNTLINISGPQSITNQISAAYINIFSYNSSVYKTILCSTSQDLNGSGVVQNTTGMWASVAAISTITLLTISNNFAIGTTATLFGILKA